MLVGESMVKYAKNLSHTSNHSHIYGINIKKPIPNFFHFHNKAMVHFGLNLWLVTNKV
jgi:hypothetical protein